MAWTLERLTVFDWEWSVANSAYGASGGVAGSRNAAIIEMVIAEAELFEEPYTAGTKQKMRADPDAWVQRHKHEVMSVLQDERHA